jgi:hypothetical protein
MHVVDTLVTQHACLWLKVFIGCNAWLEEGQHVIPNIKVATWQGAGRPKEDPSKLLTAARPLLVMHSLAVLRMRAAKT